MSTADSDSKERNRLLGLGIVLGMIVGMVAGLIFFDNIGIGLALGPAIGIAAAIGIHESRKAKRTGAAR